MKNGALTVLIIVSGLLLFSVSCGFSNRHSLESPKIAVSNSYLEAAINDVLGVEQSCVRLSEPGTCPGHFDLRPSHVGLLRGCRLFFLFEFQEPVLNRQLSGVCPDDLRVVVRSSKGLGHPDTYITTCRQAAAALNDAGYASVETTKARLNRIEGRINELWSELRKTADMEGLLEKKVIVSLRQAGFCEALGMRVVATFKNASSMSVSEIDEAITRGEREGVTLVIANRPEGKRVADAIASRIGAEVVVLKNFPDAPVGVHGYDSLLRGNVRLLTE